MAEKINSQFNKAATTSPNISATKAVSQGQGSQMVRNDRPAPKPVPPQNVRHAVDGQIHLQQKIKEHQAVLQRNAQIAKPGKPVIDLKHQQEAVRLREKFKQAAAKERDQGR